MREFYDYIQNITYKGEIKNNNQFSYSNRVKIISPNLEFGGGFKNKK